MTSQLIRSIPPRVIKFLSTMTSNQTTIPKKRHIEESEPQGPPTKKVWPLFGKDKGALKGSFTWLPRIASTCLTGENAQFECRPKIAFFDLDGTLIEGPRSHHPVPPDKWKWWSKDVPEKLKELHDSGYSIVIITNQGSAKHVKNCEEKVPLIMAKVPNIPLRIFASSIQDRFRKPRTGSFRALQEIYSDNGVAIDLESSFFVGDAAGRKMPTKADSDHSDCDIKYAENIGVKFYTPEEFFLSHPKPTNIVLEGFHPKLLQRTPQGSSCKLATVTGCSPPIPSAVSHSAHSHLPTDGRQEIIVFVGFPAIGKSRFYKKHLAPAGYSHINQDTLKTLTKCVKTCSSHLEEGKSVAIDNTNRNAETRSHYVALSKKFNLPVRCFWFSGSIQLARHNNLYRAHGQPPSSDRVPRGVLPPMAFNSFASGFEPPTVDEGFHEVKEIHWIFEGTEEEDKAYYMWYS